MADLNTTATLSPEVSTYYEKTFLKRADYEYILDQGGQKRTHATGEGRTVNFTRYTPLAINTTPLGEGSNPSISNITASTISMTLSEYGQTVQLSKFLSLVSIDSGMKEKISLVGQNMGQTLNRLVRNELDNGTAFFANGKNTSTYAASDTFSASMIRGITRTLELANAPLYDDGMYMGKAVPQSKYQLLGDTTWVNAKTYSDVKGLYKGEMGELYQVRWLLNKDASSGYGAASEASVIAAFNTYVHGKDAFGVFDLEGDKPKLYILPNIVDGSSPAGRISKVSWAGSFATKILNSAWVVVAKTPTS